MEDSARIKRRQIGITLAVVTAVVSLVVLGLYLSDPSRRVKQAAGAGDIVKSYRTPSQSLDPSEVWITRSETELQDLKHTNDELRRELTEIQDKIERLRRPQEGSSRPIDRTLPPLPPPPLPAQDLPSGKDPATRIDRENASVAVAQSFLPPPPSPPRRADSGNPRGNTPSSALNPSILVVDLAAEPNVTATNKAAGDKSVAAGKTSGHDVHNFLPAGAFAKAMMLSGLDAPTGGLAKTNPQPVLLRLLDPGTLPNRYRSRIQECFVTAAGYGDLASERAYLRLEKLSCVLKTGEVLEASLKGFVTGEDGKAGLRGRVVSKQGQMIARALIAGVAGGIGSGVAQSFTSLSTNALGNVQSIDPGKIAQYGVANGFASALDRISQWYLERANEVYPVLEVDAGRRVEVVLNEGLELGADVHDTGTHTGEIP
ncbi:MAG: TrbI/VirB10 family protein [Gemmatimonadales bacterium]